MAESYKNAIENAKADIGTIQKAIQDLGKVINGLDTSIISKLNKTFNNSPKEMTDRIITLEKEVKKLSDALNAQKNKTDQLVQAKKALSQLSAQEKVDTAILNKSAKEAAILNSQLAGAYDKLKVKRDQALKDLRNLVAQEDASAKSIKKAQQNYEKYAVQMDKVKESERALRDAKKDKIAREKAQSDAISKSVVKHIEGMTKQSQLQKELSADYRKFERESAAQAKALEKEQIKREKSAKALKEYNNEYNKLVRRRNQTRKKLQTLLATENASITAINKARRAYAKYGAKIDEINAKLKQYRDNNNKVKREAAISKQLTGQMIESVNAIGKTNDGLKRMRQHYIDLDKELKKQEQQQKKINKEKERAAALAAKEAAKQAHLNRAYVKLANQQRAARDVLRDLIASQKASRSEIKKAQAEYDRLTKRINKANAATKSFAATSKTSLSRTLAGVRNLAAAFGVVGGAFIFADIVKRGFRLARSLDSIDFAMRTVITDANELARTQAFLTDITDRYGAELVTTTERYNKFLAAAKQSGVSLQDTEQIFGTMTKAAGSLGLKTHELEGVYLALEQMLSKGKVTTEELRRQLGERLPGAFGIMAKAVDKLNPDVKITVSELDKMLKKGEVLSAEVLPEFARQVEIAYGIQTLDRVENLNASVARLSNSWTIMVRDMTESGGLMNRVLIGSIDELSKRLTEMSEGFKRIGHELEVGERSWQRFTDWLREINTESAITKSMLDNVINVLLILKVLLSIKIWDVWAEIIKFFVTTFDSLVRSLEQVTVEFRDFTRAIKEGIPLFTFFSNAADRIGNAFTDTWDRAYTAVKQGIFKVGKEYDIFFEKYGTIAPLEPDTKAWDFTMLGEGTGAMDDYKDSVDGASEAIEGSVKWIEEQINALQKKRDTLINTHEAYAEINEEIARWEEELRKLQEGDSSIKYLENKIRLLKEEREQKAKTHKEYMEFTEQLEEYEKILDRIIEGEKTLIEIRNGTYQDKLDDQEAQRLQAIEDNLNQEVLAHRRAAQIIEAIRTGSMENAVDLSKAQFELIKGILADEAESKKELGEKTKEFALAAMEGVMERRVELVQREIEENRDYYAELLNNQELSEEQRDALEAERDAKERKLEKKKRKREKEAFLLQQGMAVAEIAIQLAKQIALINTTAAAIDSLTFGIGGNIYRSANLPIAIGTAAVQTGIILAQSLPQFAEGTDNAPKGLALVDEIVPEVHTDKFGNIKSFGENKPNYRMLEQGDKIYPSREEYAKDVLTGNAKKGLKGNIEKMVFDMNLNSQGRQITQQEVDKSIMAQGINELKKSNEKVWKEVKKLAGRPVIVNNQVELVDDRHY